MASNPASRLIDYGQSVWYDNISREILQNGELKKWIEEWGIRGLTSNPTIFDQALAKGNAYDSQISALKSQNLSTDALFEELAVQDIATAADLLRPVYEQSSGVDGFVSIEVSPLLARDASATIAEARKLFARLERPNIMIKIPGTVECLPAIKTCLEEGINVNVTLLFSVENYRKVAETYCEALQARASKGLPINKIQSVASFFVSRVDSIVDDNLAEIASANPEKAEKAKELRGKFGIANCRLAYKVFKEIFYSDSFSKLKAAGASVQRPLWASTGTKNPNYRDVLYVEQLIAPDTVNTVPHATLAAFVDHGELSNSLDNNFEQAAKIAQQLESLGVDLSKKLNFLQVDGVDKFIKSFHALNKTLEVKLGG
jgi:transaldolase